MRVRLKRNSDETFAAESAGSNLPWKNVIIGGSACAFAPAQFNTLFEPAPEPRPVGTPIDPALEKLAKIIFKSDRDDDEDWGTSLEEVKNSYLFNARAVLAAGYLPPPEPPAKTVRVKCPMLITFPKAHHVGTCPYCQGSGEYDAIPVEGNGNG